jgi:hypothetical protein
MSYYIQRIKISEICRAVVDTLPLSHAELDATDYQDVIALDRRFEDFFQELPSFFKVDPDSLRETATLMHQKPYLQIQRFALLMIAHTRRCKLHQPFLIRRSMDRHYDFSREISLKSAQAVLRMRALFQREAAGSYIASTVRHTGVVYHIFIATIVLVMDLCFNKGIDADSEIERKAEVSAAIKMLDEAKQQSAVVRQSLEALTDVLRKHKVRLYTGDVSLADFSPHKQHVALCNNSRMAYAQSRSSPEMAPPTSLQDTIRQVPYQAAVDNMSHGQSSSKHFISSDCQSYQTLPQYEPSDFDSIFQEYVDFGPNMDIPGWDNLFSDLDTTVGMNA